MHGRGTTWRLRWFDEIDSTNRWLADEVRSGRAGDGDVAVARFQSAGRGRLGRSWEAPADSALLLSAFVVPSLPLEQWHLAGLAMALAVVDAAGRSGVEVPVGLKWPNDVVVPQRGERKLAGVLAELITGPAARGLGRKEASDAAVGRGVDGVVVGVGVNRVRPPSVEGVLLERAVWLDELGPEGGVASGQVLAGNLLDAFGERLDLLERDGPALLAAYRTHCSTIGRRVRVELPGATLEGIAVGVSPDGHLHVVGDTGGSQDVAAGDVVHLHPL